MIPELEWVANGPILSADDHRSWMQKGQIWVAEDEKGKLLGFLTCQIFGKELHIWEVSVRQDAQGKGIGRGLMEMAKTYAVNNGLTALTLTTFRGVAFNQLFYSKLGYQTLASERLSVRLSGILKGEAAAGLPADQRCAMQQLIQQQ